MDKPKDIALGPHVHFQFGGVNRAVGVFRNPLVLACAQAKADQWFVHVLAGPVEHIILPHALTFVIVPQFAQEH